MTNTMSASAKRQLILGEKVDKATGTLANGTTTLFTITGGRVLITSLIGRVTTAVGATTSNAKLVYNPTAAGTSFDLCTAVDIASDAVEQTYHLASTSTDAAPGALIVTGAVGQAIPGVLAFPMVLQAGTIEQNLSADPVGGAITWSICWAPYDDLGSLA
jgi:hypothetical protein